jgi:hypothetical protein
VTRRDSSLILPLSLRRLLDYLSALSWPLVIIVPPTGFPVNKG